MSSQILLERSAFNVNLEFIRSILNPGVRISSVVKGNAYGHGLDSFPQMAEEAGIDHFSVYSSEEARKLRSVLKPGTEIMIMGYVAPGDVNWVIENGISFYVFDFKGLKAAISASVKKRKKARIHVEVETGMNRTGFSEKDIDQLVGIMKEHETHLEFTGLCTHFAGAESISNYVRVQNQKKKFLKMSKRIVSLGLTPLFRHTCCSAATIRLPEMHLDMVRIGIMQYGFWPSREVFIEYLKGRKGKEDPLKRVLSWESRIMSVKEVEMGEFVGYGTTYLAQKDMKIAVVPVGYSHGFSRSLSNIGRVLVKGIRTMVLGMVNMNSLTIDVTEVDDVKVHDKVTLIGQDGDQELSVSSFSELSDQLNYELLTRLPIDIPRKIT